MAATLHDLHSFLVSKETILHLHPNDALDFQFPDSWPSQWQDVVEEHPQLDRKAVELGTTIRLSSHQISKKKYHEVIRMTEYIANLLWTRYPDLEPSHVHIVDIGAGHAYLSRALHSLFGAPILALDINAPKHTTNGITHKTIHITPTTLIQAINDWIPSTPSPIPVLLVALHACGSLSPDILRAFISSQKSPSHNWYPISLVAVGCCYNLMSLPDDFPLSSTLLTASPLLTLPKSAFHLASQIPSHWHDSPETLAAATLAIRKVVWRALLTPLLNNSNPDTPIPRLGRLSNSAYATWDTFLDTALQKLGIQPSFQPQQGSAPANSVSSGSLDTPGPHPERPPPLLHRDESLERKLQVLHVMRCHLGPVIESLIVLDRVQWLREVLYDMGMSADGASADPAKVEHSNAALRPSWQVEIVNLFDQATGSGRNMAVVIAPPLP